MQKIVFLLLIIFSATEALSQQEFFVYFQADNHQPFYARINTKIYSSSENGQMIIPKLHDSTYEVVIGFAKNAFPEQLFSIPVNKKDKGFQLKNLGDQGWALVNLQNTSVIMNAGVSLKPVQEMAGIKKTDAFSELLANVVNDSSILYSIVKKDPEPVPEKTAPVTAKAPDKVAQDKEVAVADNTAVQPPPETVAAVAKKNKKDTTLARKGSIAIIPTVKTEENNIVTGSTANEAPVLEKPFITRIEEKKTPGMYQATYLEQYILTTDTVKITILLTDSPLIKTTAAPIVVENKTDSIPDVTKSTEDKTVPPPKAVAVDTASNTRGIVVMNSDCKNFASDYDVDKLRVKLISDKTIDDKLISSKKFLKIKCLSVKQIKALTELFPSDETKYRFFDIAYPFVSDTSNFYQLEEMIETIYYKNRFKAMIAQ